MCRLHFVIVSDDKHLVVDGGAVLFWFTFFFLLPLLLISYRGAVLFLFCLLGSTVRWYSCVHQELFMCSDYPLYLLIHAFFPCV